MSHRSTGKRWLALTATTAVFAVVVAFVAPTINSAPLPENHRILRPEPMFGGGPSRNFVNLFDRKIVGDWSVTPGKEKNILWSERLGTKAYGGPIIDEGRLFIGTNNGNPRNPKVVGDKGVMMCLDARTGKFQWQSVFDKLAAGRVNDWPELGICSAPAVVGDRLYYVSNRCEVVCARVDTGAIDWKLDMIGKLRVFPHNLAVCSPLIVGGLLFVVTGNGVDLDHRTVPRPKAPSFLALDRRTGDVVWQAIPDEKITHGQWSNPVFARVAATAMIVFPGGDGWLYAFDPPTGKRLWKFDCGLRPAVGNHFVATPVVWENKLYVGVGDDPERGKNVGHLWCVDLARAIAKGQTNPGNDVSSAKNNFDPKAAANANSALGWHYGGDNPTQMPRDFIFGRTMSNCAVHDGLVYAAEYDGILHCLDAMTGEKYWEHDMERDTWCSPYWVDGKVYLGNDNGEVLVFEHGRKKVLLNTIDMGRGAKVRTAPVASNGVLYVVTENPCKVYALRAP